MKTKKILLFQKFKSNRDTISKFALVNVKSLQELKITVRIFFLKQICSNSKKSSSHSNKKYHFGKLKKLLDKL